MIEKKKPFEFYIVGSALSDSPRDTDILCVMDDHYFKTVFKLDVNTFKFLLNNNLDQEGLMENWKRECTGATRILQTVFSMLVPIDFKFIPRSLLLEPYREVDLTTPPCEWGIAFPDLTKHVDEYVAR